MRLLLVVLGLLLAMPAPADACSCAPQPFDEHVKSAAQVFLARAGKPAKTQSFTVLATLKGAATKRFVLDRSAPSPCSPSYVENEVAILFASGGRLDLCHGNMGLASQIAELAKILDATGAKRGDATAPSVEAAIRHALAKYTHGRPKIHVRHAPLAGTSFRMGKSTFELTDKPAKGEVHISQAFATDSLALVEGTYETEGLRFTVLLHKSTAWSVAWASVAER